MNIKKKGKREKGKTPSEHILSPQRRSERHRYPVSLDVYVASHFHCVAGFPHVNVVVFGRLDEKRELAVGVSHPPDALVVGVHQHLRPRVHELPHFAVQRAVRFLAKQHKIKKRF